MPASIAIELESRGSASAAPMGSPVARARDVVLLVEDDEGIASLLAHLVERMNWRVVRAGDGAECRRLIAAHRAEIALAFVDCTLPDAHGGSLCESLRAAVPGLPVLLMSGRAQPGLLNLVAADGPAAFLPKPFMPDDVARQLGALMAMAA